MPRPFYRYAKRGIYIPFSYRKCKTCGDDINPSRGPQGKAYTYCAKCCSPGPRDSRARSYRQRRLSEARKGGAF